MNENANIVRAFKEAPDTIFLGYQGQQPNQHFLKILTQTSQIESTEVHGGPIIEIHHMNWNGNHVIFTSSQDYIIRAFTIENNGSEIKLQVQ